MCIWGRGYTDTINFAARTAINLYYAHMYMYIIYVHVPNARFPSQCTRERMMKDHEGVI